MNISDKIDNIEAVHKMQEYIRDHLMEVITLKDLAAAACYSPYYASRVFKSLIGISPFAYLRSMRLSKAAILMRDHLVKVVDVAFDFVFDSHEGFTRAFSKEFGLTPKAYQDKTPPIRLFIPYDVRGYHKAFAQGGKNKMSEKSKTVFVQVIERPARKAIIKRGVKAEDYYDYCEEAGCDVWGILTSIKDALYEPVGMWLPARLIKPGTSRYVQGVEVPVDYKGALPEGFELVELAPCKMMIFQGEPFEDDEFEQAIDGIWEAMDHYDPKLYGFEWDEEAGPRFQMEPQGYRGYIEGKPVRPVNR